MCSFISYLALYLAGNFSINHNFRFLKNSWLIEAAEIQIYVKLL